jgi:dolichyl-phosphate-mannose--protein O-mannosyl transferase
MKNDLANQTTGMQTQARWMKTLVYGCISLGFVLAVGTAGFVVVSNLGIASVAQVAEMGPGLYGETLQLPLA